MKMRYDKGGRKPDFLDLDKDGNTTEPMANTYMGGGKYYKMGGEYEHGGEHGGRKNDFLVRDAEKLRDRNPDKYADIADEVIGIMLRNNMESSLGDQVMYDPLNLNPNVVQDYLNFRAKKRKKSLGRILKGLGAGAAVGYLASDADTDGFYREGTSTRLVGTPDTRVSRPTRKLQDGTIMSPTDSFANPNFFEYTQREGDQRLTDVPADRQVGQMSDLMLLLGRLAGDIYKGKRYE